MMRNLTRSTSIPALCVALGLMVAGCSALEPSLPTADPQIPASWPIPPETAEARPAAETEGEPLAPTAADIGWRDFFRDEKLATIVAQALENNRDLRVAVLNVERARALYRIQRADQLPSIDATGTLTRSGGSGRSNLSLREYYQADIGITNFELDLFGRVHNLSQAALRRYFAQEEARRSAQLTLVAEVANAYLTLSADQELQRVARDALANRQRALDLIRQRHELGAVSSLELSQAEAELETARADLSRFTGFVAQDLNALNLLVGAPVPEELLPQSFDAVSGVTPLPAGVPSEVLLRRPDIIEAEQLLRAANANIGAARAAFFPSITLTGSIGTASTEFDELFSSGTGVWSFIPRINLPIFQGGRLRANLGVATADRDIALARYEQAIQNGFREVADALALTRTLAEQKAAVEAQLAAAQRAYDLSEARYKAGLESFITLLDTQRTLYQAQQQLVDTLRAEQANRVTLYRVLGGGWLEASR